MARADAHEVFDHPGAFGDIFKANHIALRE
jgi:hypothetical protein